MGKFLSRVSLSALRHAQEIFNSRLKRGEIERPETILSTHQVYCGCGNERCTFISVQRPRDDEPVDR